MIITAPQVFGIVVGLFFVYYSYIQFRKKVFGLFEFLVWLLVWTSLVALAAISEFISLTQVIYIYSILDIVIVVSMVVLFGLVFTLFLKFKKYQKKTNDVVMKMALLDAKESKEDGSRKKG